ncbi:MAG: hypothetical protein ACI4L6_03945 [Candidatus Onthoplasma sp.]
MIVFYEDNLHIISSLIEKRAKFQKVMIVFDDFASSQQVEQLVEQIKKDCVFKSTHIKFFSDEIYDGYKAIIFLCTANSFLSLKYRRDEFVSIFVPQDRGILPFFINDNKFFDSYDYLLLKTNNIDTNIVSSLVFNQVFSHIENLLSFQETTKDVDFLSGEINTKNLVDKVQDCGDLIFEDLNILKQQGIEYNNLPIVDLMIIDAIEVFTRACREKLLSMVDVFKIYKNDESCVDKFYAMSKNEGIVHILNMNHNCVISICEKAKEKILPCVDIQLTNRENLQNIFEKVKKYAKKCENLIGYLYFYNVLG